MRYLKMKAKDTNPQRKNGSSVFCKKKSAIDYLYAIAPVFYLFYFEKLWMLLPNP
jgi:hypothetical protein